MVNESNQLSTSGMVARCQNGKEDIRKSSGTHGTHHPPQTSLYEGLRQPLRHVGGAIAQTLVNLSDSEGNLWNT